MTWRSDWALLDRVRVSDRFVWYRFQYRDGTQRCIVADGKRNTIDEVCTMLDRAEREREAKRICMLI